MQYEAKTPADYITLLESDWRKDKLLAIRKLIQNASPALVEDIDYKMLRYRAGDSTIFHLNAQKGYVSLYVGNIEKVSNAREMLREFDMGKGCIRIKKNINLADTQLDLFINEVLDLWKKGGNTDC